jgi:hypothetical protein
VQKKNILLSNAFAVSNVQQMSTLDEDNELLSMSECELRNAAGNETMFGNDPGAERLERELQMRKGRRMLDGIKIPEVYAGRNRDPVHMKLAHEYNRKIASHCTGVRDIVNEELRKLGERQRPDRNSPLDTLQASELEEKFRRSVSEKAKAQLNSFKLAKLRKARGTRDLDDPTLHRARSTRDLDDPTLHKMHSSRSSDGPTLRKTHSTREFDSQTHKQKKTDARERPTARKGKKTATDRWESFL